MAGRREEALAVYVKAMLADACHEEYRVMRVEEDHFDRLRAALALPPDPAPGMDEIERLVDEYTESIDTAWEESAHAALLAAIRALAAPGADRYAEGWRAGQESMQEACVEALVMRHPGAADLIRAIRPWLPVPEPAPDRYAEGAEAMRKATLQVMNTRYTDAGRCALVVMKLMDDVRALPVPEPAPAGEKETP